MQGILLSQFTTGIQNFIKDKGLDKNNDGMISLKDEMPSLWSAMGAKTTKFGSQVGLVKDSDNVQHYMVSKEDNPDLPLYMDTYVPMPEKNALRRSETAILFYSTESNEANPTIAGRFKNARNRFKPTTTDGPMTITSYHQEANAECHPTWQGAISQVEGKIKFQGGQVWAMEDEYTATVVEEKYYDGNGKEIPDMYIYYKF